MTRLGTCLLASRLTPSIRNPVTCDLWALCFLCSASSITESSGLRALSAEDKARIGELIKAILHICLIISIFSIFTTPLLELSSDYGFLHNHLTLEP